MALDICFLFLHGSQILQDCWRDIFNPLKFHSLRLSKWLQNLEWESFNIIVAPVKEDSLFYSDLNSNIIVINAAKWIKCRGLTGARIEYHSN